MGVGVQGHALAGLTPGKTQYPLYRRLDGTQVRSGGVRKISPPHRDSIPGPSKMNWVTTKNRYIKTGYDGAVEVEEYTPVNYKNCILTL
jgi:hypothetical protein